jgi:hypothetical protein
MDGRQHHQRRSGSPVVAPAPTTLQEDCDGMNETILNTLATHERHYGTSKDGGHAGARLSAP